MPLYAAKGQILMNTFFLIVSYGLTLIPFAVAIVLAFLLFYGAINFYHRPVNGIYWVIWLFVIETALIFNPSLPLGIQLFLPDLLFLLLAMSGLLRIFSIKLHREHYVWLLYGAVLLLSFGMGTVKFGTTAGVEFRAFFYFWSGIWYLMTFKLSSSDVDKIIRSWMLGSAVLSAIALFRWVAMALGMDIVSYWNEGGNSLRVFSAAETYFLAQALVIGLYAYLNKTAPKWWGVLLPLLLICVVLLQHRTLWVVTFVSIALLFLSAGKIRSKAASTFLVGALVGTALLIPFLSAGHLDTVQQSLAHSVQEVGKDNSTMAWRLQSWRALVEQWAHGGPLVNLVGFPFGSGFARHIEAAQQELTQSPHSQYVTVLLRTGVVGILTMLLAYYFAVVAMRKLPAHTNQGLIDGKLLMALLLGQLLFFVTYSVQYIQLLPLGLSLVLLGQHRYRAVNTEKTLQAGNQSKNYFHGHKSGSRLGNTT